MKQETREWLVFIAAVLALAGVGAGYGLVNFSLEASPSAENYVQQRALFGFLEGALAVTNLLAPVVSLTLAVIGRSLIGVLPGVLALAFAVVWVPMHSRACCGTDEANVIGVLRSINSAQGVVVSTYFVEAHLIDAIPDRRHFATDDRGTVYFNRDGTVIQPGMAGAEPVQ